jgi:hypothetical protein
VLVLDENLNDHRLIAALSSWFPGKVISITELRPRSIIKDDAVSTLLHKVSHPSFVTINVTDFWKKIHPHADYCIIAVDLPKKRSREIPDLLRVLFRHPTFRTKASRMGKIIRLTHKRVDYYESDRHILSIALRD